MSDILWVTNRKLSVTLGLEIRVGYYYWRL